MMKRLLLFLLLAPAAFGYDYNLSMRFPPADSVRVIVQGAGTVDTTLWTALRDSIDTTISLTGANFYQVWTDIFYNGESYWMTAWDDFLLSDTTITGGYRFRMYFAPADSSRLVKGNDTVLTGAVSSIDTTFATVDSGVFVFQYFLKYDEDWIGGPYVFDNTAAMPVARTANKCNVTIHVQNAGGNPVRDAIVSCYLIGSNLRDSTGTAIANITTKKRTNSSGNCTFECLWSSYIIPATMWRFYAYSPQTGGAYQDVTVPRQSTYTVTFD